MRESHSHTPHATPHDARMRPWIKICGLTTHEGVHAAAAAGADAIGFVFAPSKRRVTPARAVELAQAAGGRVLRVAVMLHPPQSLLDEVWSAFRPDVLQTDAEDLAALRIPAGLQVLPVVRAGGWRSQEVAARVLFEGAVSGAGETADWDEAARLARGRELVLAGGLNPTNVASAVERVQPFGVDVSSGVESAPGVKDPLRIYEFVREARGDKR